MLVLHMPDMREERLRVIWKEIINSVEKLGK